jgi:hypothetical protein
MGRVNIISDWGEKYKSTNDKIKEKQEDTRSKMATRFSIFFFVVITFYILYTIFWDPNQQKINLLNIILSATTWFVWTIIWFYFWEKSKD